MVLIGSTPTEFSLSHYDTGIKNVLSSFSGKTIIVSFFEFNKGWGWLKRLISLQAQIDSAGLSSNIQILAVVYRYLYSVSASQMRTKVNADPDVAGKLTFPVLLDKGWLVGSALTYLNGFLNSVDPLYHDVLSYQHHTYIVSPDYTISDKWHSYITQSGDPYSLCMIPPVGQFDSSAWDNSIPFIFGRSSNVNAQPVIVSSTPVQNASLSEITSVQILFSKLMADSAAAAANYSISGVSGITITGASFTAENRVRNIATLTLSGTPTCGTLVITILPAVTDMAGTPLPSGSNTVSFVIDNEAPVVSNFTLTGTSPVSSQNITFTLSASDNTGITGYLINESSVPPSADDSAWTASLPSNALISGGSGIKTVYAWTKDAAGNVNVLSSSNHFEVTLSSALPQVTQFSLSGSSPLNTQTVSCSLLSVTPSGTITGWMITESSDQPVSSDPGWLTSCPASYSLASAVSGIKHLYAWVKNSDGDISPLSASSFFQFTADFDKPVITVFTLLSDTNTPIRSIMFDLWGNDGSDEWSGICGWMITESSTPPDPGGSAWLAAKPYTYYLTSSPGTIEVYAWAKDAAGNVNAISGTSHFTCLLT